MAGRFWRFHGMGWGSNWSKGGIARRHSDCLFSITHRGLGKGELLFEGSSIFLFTLEFVLFLTYAAYSR